jgi:hypothetical protein
MNVHKVWVGALIVAATMTTARAAEPFVGRWAVKADVCSGHGDKAATAALVATDTSLWWFDGYCRIGKMYKLGTAVYLQVHCGSKGEVPVTLDAKGDRMRVTWDRGRAEELRRCP